MMLLLIDVRVALCDTNSNTDGFAILCAIGARAIMIDRFLDGGVPVLMLLLLLRIIFMWSVAQLTVVISSSNTTLVLWRWRYTYPDSYSRQ